MEKIYLIGFMASGKTTVGKIVAEKLGWSFVDTDDLIEKRKSMSIKEIFSSFGEKYFRELEKEVLLSLLSFNKIVVAVGGGLPVYFDNMDVMLKSGFTVYLEVSEDILMNRLANKDETEKRPLANSKDNLITLLKERQKIYEMAHKKVRCDKNSPQEIGEQIIKSYVTWKRSQ
jgi:shikimate kinase